MMKYLSDHLIPLLTLSMLCACGDGMEFATLDQEAHGSLYGVDTPSRSPVAPACLLAGPKSLHLEAQVGTSTSKKF